MAKPPDSRARHRGRHGAGEKDTGDLLLLAGEQQRSSWLEAEQEEEGSAFDPRRIFIAALIGCALVVAAITGTFWVFGERADPEIVADGSVIRAPTRPYKIRPDDPGGAQVAGTGDVSFEVAEGREHEGVFAPDAFAVPGGDDENSQAPEASVVGVQVGAFATREAAQQGWARMRARSETLQGRTYRIVEGNADSGPVFGLQAVAAGAADAAALCQAIRDDGGDCQIKR